MATINALDTTLLYRSCDPSTLPFETTAELAGATDIVGQERAVDAIDLGMGIRRPGYNLFVLGDPGSGRHCAVRGLLEARAAAEPVPGDWCYIHNFGNPNAPRLMRLPPGRGRELKRDMERFVTEMSKAIPAAFEGDEYRTRVEAINNAFQEREEQALADLGKAAVADGIGLLRTPRGFVFAPLKGEEPMAPDEFQKLPEAERERIGNLIESHGERLQRLMSQLPRWRREVQGQIKEANRDTLNLAVGHLIEELKARYADLDAVQSFLDEALRDVAEVGEQLREPPKADADLANLIADGNLSALRYQVNLLVDHAGSKAAPIVYEDNPIYPNLVGRVDHVAQLGTLLTNFTLIKPGALHLANGGYLVLDALKVLSQPYAWEGLKRALRAGQLRIESLGQIYGLVSTVSLEPEPMPLDLKVVLIGERRVYYLLKALDPEFAELFKIAADFEDELERSPDNTRLYAEFIATLAKRGRLMPVDRAAVARLIEHAARLCDDAGKLSASRRRMTELLQEADHWAAGAGRKTIRREDVETALDAQTHRADRLRDRLHEEILRDTLLISVSESRVGQVNGLAVVALDDFLFAHPVRITATARVGDGSVIDIEREAELGGAIHSKGVMILAAFLGARYARVVPLSLSATLVFEQSYGAVEGDSASLAELCALLSDLAGVPIRQSLAVTGSVNQLGDVQPIGAVNEKIEGFFDICRARGLTGDQGVLIPAANVKHLMLRRDVVEACAGGRFAVYAASNVDEAIELLTGVPAGAPDAEGLLPRDSINFLVAMQLTELSAVRQAFSAAAHLQEIENSRGEAEDDASPPP